MADRWKGFVERQTPSIFIHGVPAWILIVLCERRKSQKVWALRRARLVWVKASHFEDRVRSSTPFSG